MKNAFSLFDVLFCYFCIPSTHRILNVRENRPPEVRKTERVTVNPARSGLSHYKSHFCCQPQHSYLLKTNLTSQYSPSTAAQLVIKIIIIKAAHFSKYSANHAWSAIISRNGAKDANTANRRSKSKMELSGGQYRQQNVLHCAVAETIQG